MKPLKQQRQQHKNLLWQFIQLYIFLPRDVKGEIFVNIPMARLGLDRATGSIDLIDSINVRNFRRVGKLEICLVSKFQLCTTLQGRKNAKKPKRKFVDRLSIPIRSIR